MLHRLADLIEKHALELAVLGVRDNGTEISHGDQGRTGHPPPQTFRYYAEAIDKVYGEIAPTADNVLALIHREPVGVVGAIVPWNFPLMIGAWKMAPALADGQFGGAETGGNRIADLLRLAELALEAGVPPGVLQRRHRAGSRDGRGTGAVDGC